MEESAVERIIPSSMDRCKIYSMPESTTPSLAVTPKFEINARAEALGVGLSLLFFLSHVIISPCIHPSSAPAQITSSQQET